MCVILESFHELEKRLTAGALFAWNSASCAVSSHTTNKQSSLITASFQTVPTAVSS